HIRKKDGGLGELMVGFLQKATFFQRVSQQIDMEDTDTLNLTFEYGKLKDNKNTTYDTIVMPPIPKLSDEQINILSLSLTASGDSYLSVLIDKLGNADWIRTGLVYIEDEHCPFCQEKTINEHFKSEVKKVFDDSYDKTIHEITKIYTTYKEATHNYVDA
ncbi:TPA: AAA family ATPase, partial [Klebsiella pneumoniae]|nr:AAA family ATPase [Klebsiella pneumoniae]